MKIIDLSPEHESKYFCCLEEWSEEMKEAGAHKSCWYHKVKDKGLRVKLAQDSDGKICGMIQYLPVEQSFFEGRDLYAILCIWVHGHKQGVGDRRKKGIGKELLRAAEDDVRSLGSKGIAAWGIILPFFMRASWFKKQGYKVADKDSIIRLLWKPFTPDATPPTLIKRKKTPEIKPGKINVSLFLSGWCPAQNIVYERTKRALSGFEELAEMHEFNTLDKDLQREWGISDAVFIDRKEIRNGPPTSYKKIRSLIEKKAKKVSAGK